MKLHDKTANYAVVYWVTHFHTICIVKNFAVDLLVSIKSYRKSLIFVELNGKVYFMKNKQK